MAIVHFRGFGDFAKRGIPRIKKDANNLELELHKDLHRTLLQLVRAHTPELTGSAKKSWGSAGSSGGPVATDFLLARLKPGQSSRVVATSPIFNLIDKGRRMTKASDKRKSFPIGSLQEPKGTTKPALSQLESLRSQIKRRVIKKVEKRG